ncbi:MAG: hypothetical protein WBM61_06705, partial [Woeseiaceae bacterium]
MRTAARTLIPVLLSTIATLSSGVSQATTPTIRLFPTTVVEDLRQTGNVARDMETGLQEVIGRLDQQQELYQESKCDGAEDDSGCQRLARQIGASYLDMLTIMEERLPDMEHTVNNTRQSLEKGLRNELGKKMTPWLLQETLIGGNANNATTKASPTLRGRSGMRLSERFKQYYQLVATSGAKGDQSLAVLASDIYLDMEETTLL